MAVAPPQAQVTETPAPGWGNHAGVPVPFTGAQPQVRQDAQPVRKAAPVPWPRQPVAASGSRLGELRHSLDVTDLVFSHSGDRLATASVDATVKLWDGTGRQTGQMRHERAVAGIALSPDDTRLISRLRAPAIGHSRSVILWDAVTGQELSRLQHNTNVVSARFSRDGTRIATVSDEKIARLWSPEGEEMARLSHDRHVIAAGFSRDSSRLITLGQLSSVAVLWNAATGQFVAPIQHENHVRATAFSPDSTRLISFSSDGTTRLWETAAGLDAPWLERMDAWVIAFAPDSSVLATASAGTVVRLWDLATAGLIGGLPHDRPVTSLAYSPSGDSIATATGSLVRIWGTGSGRELALGYDQRPGIGWNETGYRLFADSQVQPGRQ
jgi:WD40 repeat protein